MEGRHDQGIVGVPPTTQLHQSRCRHRRSLYVTGVQDAVGSDRDLESEKVDGGGGQEVEGLVCSLFRAEKELVRAHLGKRWQLLDLWS